MVLMLSENNDLTGSLPSEIGKLTQLRQLYLRKFGFFGSEMFISCFITESNFYCLFVSSIMSEDNGLKSTIPTTFGLLVDLQRLNLGKLPLLW